MQDKRVRCVLIAPRLPHFSLILGCLGYCENCLIHITGVFKCDALRYVTYQLPSGAFCTVHTRHNSCTRAPY